MAQKIIKMQSSEPHAVIAGPRKRAGGRPAGYVTPERARQLIKTSMLVARLQRIANGEPAEPYQVTAAIALLRKVLPDLQATMISGDPQLPLTIIMRDE